MKYEGHFLLWYLILMPFAKLGFPYYTTNIISWTITCISVWLILDKAPFKFYKKLLLIFTFPLLYLYPIISRCYCLIPLAIVLMSIFYKDRKEKPMRYLLSIVLLANTHIIMLGMVGVVLLDYIWEFCKEYNSITESDKNKRKVSLFIIIILLIITLLPLIGCLETNDDLKDSNNVLLKLFTAFFYYPILLIMDIYNCFINDNRIITIIASLVFILMYYEVIKYHRTYLKIFICIMWQCLIYSFIYSFSLQRSSSIIFILLFYKWIKTYDKEKDKDKDKDKDKNKSIIINRVVNILWIILILFNILHGIIYIYKYEITYKCSNAYQMGDYINKNIRDESIILNGPRVEFTSSIIAYINKDIKFYQIPVNRYFSYAIWDNKNNLDIELEDILKISNQFDKNKKLYYLFCYAKCNMSGEEGEYREKKAIDECVKMGIFKEIYSTKDESLYNENYVIYEVNLRE